MFNTANAHILLECCGYLGLLNAEQALQDPPAPRPPTPRGMTALSRH